MCGNQEPREKLHDFVNELEIKYGYETVLKTLKREYEAYQTQESVAEMKQGLREEFEDDPDVLAFIDLLSMVKKSKINSVNRYETQISFGAEFGDVKFNFFVGG